MKPMFSVVIPAYNQGVFLADAVNSVLQQTYPNFEILVVNDASTDDTALVMEQYTDPRVRYFSHETNRRLPAARNTGIMAAEGEWIALLDSDDYFHPNKLQAHFEFIQKHPDAQITYNSRFQLHHSSTIVRDIFRPPPSVSLHDFVLGYPFSPSDMVVQRNVFDNVGLFDERYHYFGEDLEFYTRLALAGIRFDRVNGVLNYRRYHAGRKNKHLIELIQWNTETLNKVFSDPRCPDKIACLEKQALINYYQEVICLAFIQMDFDLGQLFIRELNQLIPEYANGGASFLVPAIFSQLLSDFSLDHEVLLPIILNNLPKDLPIHSEEISHYIRRGYIYKGTQLALWGEIDKANESFARASSFGENLDEVYCQEVAARLSDYENELGFSEANLCANRLFMSLRKYGWSANAKHISAILNFNKAVFAYYNCDFNGSLRNAFNTLYNDASYLSNRGLWSVTLRSLIKLLHILL